MTHLVATIAAAAGVFAGSNIDDLIVLIVLFLGASRGHPPVWRIVAGEYLGFLLLIAGALAITAGLTVVPQRWIGLVGLVPLAIGGYGLVAGLRSGPSQPPIVPTSLLGIAGLAIANGADNLSVYAPVLRTHSLSDDVIMVCVLFCGVAVWCVLAHWLCGRHRITALLHRIGFWLVPTVFIAIGLIVVLGSGLLG